ncbi:type VI secretion system membrane subunit TssM [Xenorhabdus sp. 12]|uniref:Type VI secretion system membrane subunit TssM n=1 Tax=Xenorhabdus santafensis TaxID=2582833 RepID=A0ABU4SCH5_9GAMM|nr:type VI secretion system membrane subunit TssM [Xenorhabdus sp. 12]MDX7988507.1 type VI secretion system membrane subunit TssM [Xenorhabdus sp. 12]
MLNALLAIITSRLMWSFLNITAISSIVWFLGPLISIDNRVPLKSDSTRVIVIACISLLWLIIKLVPRLYRLWFNKKVEKQLTINQDKKEEIKQDEPVFTLAERFVNAIKLLKKAYFSGLYNKNKPHWINVFKRQYIYQIPWYLVIGEKNSGKTTALANSGLHFSLTDYLGKSALYNKYSKQATDDFNWWFTNKAVLLDTAGRYTTQDSSPNQDASEWKKLIRLLKKYRARQPINGIIITISVEDLLEPSSNVRDKKAYILSKRLSELHEQFKIQLPIYIFITKTDLLKGFTAYFTHFDKASREQIWGFNFPWGNKTNCNLHEIFEKKYNELQLRLEAELPYILLNGRNSRQCAESYLFPQEIASLRPHLAQYLEIVFAKSGFEIPCYPRGLYFTSGIQEGIAVDNVMADLNQKFQLPVDNDSNAMSWGDEKGIIPPPPAGQSYFLKNVLENIFQEAGIAGYNRWWVYRKRLLDLLGYIILFAIAAFISQLFLISYNNNLDYLAEIQHKIPTVVRQGNELKGNDDNIYALLPILNTLAKLDKSTDFSLNDPPLSYRMGLYTGVEISNASHTLYSKALKNLLLPKIAKLITNQMNTENGGDIENTYNTLKAYQMLYQPKHYDGKFLRMWVMQYLTNQQDADLDVDTTQAQLQQMNQHLSRLLDNQVVSSPFLRDDKLIKKKQIAISQIPPAQRAYNYLKNKLLNDPNLPSVNLVTLAGPQAELAFLSLDDVPGMFTPTGYKKGMNQDLNTYLTTWHSQDNWVLGSYAKILTANEIKSFVNRLYINDYINYWDKFLANIQLKNVDNLEQRISTARLLSDDDSPLRSLVINISKNVTLTKSMLDRNTPAAKKLDNVVKSKTGKISQFVPTKTISKRILPDNQQDTAGKILEEHFAQLTALAKSPDGKNKAIPFDNTLKQIKELYQYLNAVQSAIKMNMPFPANNTITQLQASSERLPVPFKSMISSLAVGASSDTQLTDMKNVAKNLGAEVSVFCRQAIAHRYPLVSGAKLDIKPDDMARMFAPTTGLMDSFFQKNLMGKIDMTESTWQFMPGIDGKPLQGGETLLKPFQQAQIIRNTLFANGAPTPSFHVMTGSVSMDNNILSMTLDVDGQKLQYSHGPQVSQLISWPGPNKTNQVLIQLNLSDGTTANLSTSGFWALNRLLNRATQIQHSKTNGDNSAIRATFNISGHRISLEFTPTSVFNPFQLPMFSCPNDSAFKTA